MIGVCLAKYLIAALFLRCMFVHRRIAYQESTQTFLVASFRIDVMDSTGEKLEHIRKR